MLCRLSVEDRASIRFCSPAVTTTVTVAARTDQEQTKNIPRKLTKQSPKLNCSIDKLHDTVRPLQISAPVLALCSVQEWHISEK